MLPETLPSCGRSWPASSTIFISQPNTGRPCLAVMAKRSASGRSRSPLLKRVVVPSGLISVMPQPWITSAPCSFQKRSIMLTGTAEPPISVRLTDDILSLFWTQ